MGCFRSKKIIKQRQRQQPRCTDPGGFKGIPVPLPAPAPLPQRLTSRAIPLPRPILRSFDFEALSSSLQNKPRSAVHRASVGNMEVDVVKINTSSSVQEWMAKLKLMAELEYHPNVSRLLGFAMGQDSQERMLVFESSGNMMRLDRALSDAPQSLDWDSRLRVALAVAKGLAHLHQKLASPAYATCFGSSNVVLDGDCDCIKLVDYGLQPQEQEQQQHNKKVNARIAPEPCSYQENNVRSYGIILLELLTGKQHKVVEGMLLAEWGISRGFDVIGRHKLASIIDPRLPNLWNVKAARVVANLALNCLKLNLRDMAQAVHLLEPLIAIELPLAATSPLPQFGNKFQRSATFSYQTMSSPSTSTTTSGFRSAGTSPARFSYKQQLYR